MAAEYVATLYLLLMFIVFPMLNYSVAGLRAFFLWFACNQSVMTAVNPERSWPSSDWWKFLYPGAYTVAQSRANQIRGVFPGINWVDSAINPEVDIIVNQIPGSTA